MGPQFFVGFSGNLLSLEDLLGGMACGCNLKLFIRMRVKVINKNSTWAPMIMIVPFAQSGPVVSLQ